MAGTSPAKTKLAGELLPLAAARFFPRQPCAVRERGNRTLTPGAQVAAAIDILASIDSGDRPADDVSADYFRRRRYIGAKDRTQISGHVYAVLRHRAAIDWWIARAAKGEIAAQARGRMIAALLLIDGKKPDDIAARFDGDRFRPAPLTPAE